MEKTLRKGYFIRVDRDSKDGDSSSTNIIDLSKQTGREVFAIHNDDCISVNVKTDMEHRIHLKKNYGVHPDDYAHLVRGYIKPGRIIFYKTAGFNKVDDIPKDTLQLLLFRVTELFGHMEYKIYNTNNGRLELLDYKYACETVIGDEDGRIYTLVPN